MYNKSKAARSILKSELSKGEQLFNNVPNMSFDSKIISDGYSIAEQLNHEQLNHELVCTTQENNLTPSKNEVGGFLLNCKMLNGISFNFQQVTLGDDRKAIWSLKTKKSAKWDDIPLCIK